MTPKKLKVRFQKPPNPPKTGITFCHEAAHYIVQEQQARIDHGMPHTAQNDVVNEWIIEMGKSRGHKPWKRDED